MGSLGAKSEDSKLFDPPSNYSHTLVLKIA